MYSVFSLHMRNIVIELPKGHLAVRKNLAIAENLFMTSTRHSGQSSPDLAASLLTRDTCFSKRNCHLAAYSQRTHGLAIQNTKKFNLF